MPKTYRQLRDSLNKLNEDQLNCDQGNLMSTTHSSKVTVHLILKDVPVHTESHPEDVTVTVFKYLLADAVENYMRSEIDNTAILKALRDYNITDTQCHNT